MTWYTKSFEVYPFFVAPQQLYLCISSPRYHHCNSLCGRNHLNLPLLMQFLMLSRQKCSFSSENAFLSLKVTLHINLIILISLRSNLNKSDSFTAQVSLTYSMTLLSHAWYTLPLEGRGKPLQVRTGKADP